MGFNLGFKGLIAKVKGKAIPLQAQRVPGG